MSAAHHAYTLHQRILTVLEALPVIGSTRRLQQALLSAAGAALQRSDLPELQRLHRESRILAESLRRAKAHDERPPVTQQQAQAQQQVLHTHAGPGLPGRGRSLGAANGSWRRPRAPIAYPYESLFSRDRRRMPEYTTSMPDAKCSAEGLARVRAWHQTRANAANEERRARQLHRRVCDHSADEPPTCCWPEDPS